MPESEELRTLPAKDGFHMPAEYEPHRGCVLIWPVRPGSWPYQAKEAQRAFAQAARTIAESETVWMLVQPGEAETVQKLLGPPIRILEIPTDDAWARDIGPTCVVNAAGEVRGIDWQFNAWGGTIDGLYAHWEKDQAAAARICEQLGIRCYDARHFVLEGGSIHTDGEGTLLVTEECLRSAGRNPQLTKAQIEETLKAYLGAEKVIWLPHGLADDETNGHVDNLCAFVRPGEVVLSWSDDPFDPQHAICREALAALEGGTDAKGRRIQVHKLPLPKNPVCITLKDLAGLVFESGEEVREAGERLAANYVNFYISNGAVLVPQFADENDQQALQILRELFPGRKAVPVDARPIIVGGGNIHCITQQIPAQRLNGKRS